MAERSLLKNTVSIEESMAATKETKKHCTLKKSYSLGLNTVTNKEKMFLATILWITAFSFELLFH